jgi:hypothetical protein
LFISLTYFKVREREGEKNDDRGKKYIKWVRNKFERKEERDEGTIVCKRFPVEFPNDVTLVLQQKMKLNSPSISSQIKLII